MLWLGLLSIAHAALFSLNQTLPVKLQATNGKLAGVMQLLFANPIWRKTMLLVPSGKGALGRLQQTVAAMMMAGAEEAVDLQPLEGAILQEQEQEQEQEQAGGASPQAVINALFRIMPKEVQV